MHSYFCYCEDHFDFEKERAYEDCDGIYSPLQWAAAVADIWGLYIQVTIYSSFEAIIYSVLAEDYCKACVKVFICCISHEGIGTLET